MKRLFLLFLPLLCLSFSVAQTPLLVKDANPDLQPSQCSPVGNDLYFYAFENLSWQPWKSDGTDMGTQRVKMIPSGSAGFNDFFEANGLAFFYATTPTTGKELWRSDGTEAGTFMVKDINPGSADGVAGNAPGIFNNRLYFAATDGQTGMELWSTDGTEAGTSQVKDIQNGPDDSFPSDFVEYNGALYFSAQGTSFWSTSSGVLFINDRELFKTDGTQQGTLPVNTAQSDDAYKRPVAPTVFKGNLYFSAESAYSGDGRELWRSDGTGAGTFRVKNIHPAPGVPALADWNHHTLLQTDDYLYFSADNGVHGRELWRSDGTEAGTTMVTDLAPGPDESVNQLIATTNSKVFFSRFLNNAFTIYASDGTPGGTVNLQKEGQLPDHIVVNGQLYFTTTDNTHFWAIWKSDGTLAGTQLFADIDGAPGVASGPADYALAGGKMFFRANDGIHGYELWKVDFTTGTAAPLTRPAFRVFPNPASDRFSVVFPPGLNQLTISVINALGATVFRQETSHPAPGALEIACGNWPAGIYFIQFQDEGNNIRGLEKIWVQ